MTHRDERQYSLQELADTAGVSIRTIRYYIGEGLLPAPAGAGPQSHYTESHAQRLRAISLLKDRYLPLKEIRRALAGLDDAEVARLIDELAGPSGVLESRRLPEAPAAAPLASESKAFYSAADYIDAALEESPSRRRLTRSRYEARSIEERDESEAWRRIEIADGVELLVREDRYRRRRDQLSWLIDWARKVVD
jgi:DNA-binding transcriptional MerR regulator